MTRLPALVALVLLALAAPAPAQTTATLRVGTIGVMADIGLYVAVERGYFAERGLKVEMVSVTSAADVMAMVAAGQIELVGGGFSFASRATSRRRTRVI